MRGQGADEWEDGGNRFQDAWNSRQHGGRHQHTQVGMLQASHISSWAVDPVPPVSAILCWHQQLYWVAEALCRLDT